MSSRLALVRVLTVVAVFALCFAAGGALGEDEQPARKQAAPERTTVALGSYALAPAPALPDLRAVPRKREPKPPPPPAPAPAPLPTEAPPVTEAPPTPAPPEPAPPESPPQQEPSNPEPARAPDPAPQPAPMPSPDAAPGAGGSGSYEDDGGSR